MWTLFWLYVLLWAALAILLIAWTLWFQGYLYSETLADWWWRAPAAATLLALFVAFWGWIDYQNPGRYGTLFLFSPTEEKDFDELTVVTNKDGKENLTRYRLRKAVQGLPEYRSAVSPYRPVPSHPDAVIVREEGQDVRFEPERDQNGKFKIRPGQSLLYVDERGRVMSEASLGRLSKFRWDLFLGNIALNLCHLVLWFVCLWVLLRFQWSHALGLAVVFWIATTMLVLPMLLGKVEEAAHNQPKQSTSGAGLQDVHDVAVLDHVGLAFEAVNAVGLCFLHGTHAPKIAVSDHFRAYESLG
jgi:hypothetical protein